MILQVQQRMAIIISRAWCILKLMRQSRSCWLLQNNSARTELEGGDIYGLARGSLISLGALAHSLASSRARCRHQSQNSGGAPAGATWTLLFLYGSKDDLERALSQAQA
jgi:hypothetical protein